MHEDVKKFTKQYGIELQKIVQKNPHRFKADRIEPAIVDVYKRRHEIDPINYYREILKVAHKNEIKKLDDEYEKSVIAELQKKSANRQEVAILGWVLFGLVSILYFCVTGII